MEASWGRRGLTAWGLAAAVFALTTAVESSSWTQLGAFTPTYLRVLGVSTRDLPAWTAALASLSWVIGIPLAPFWGVWADRYSRKAIIVRSALVEAVIFGGWAMSTSPWMALGFSILSGFVLGSTGVMLAVTTSLAPPEKLGTAIGIVTAGPPLGQALGPLTGALLIPQFGVRGMLLVDASAAAMIACLLTLVIREPERERPLGVSALRLLQAALGEIVSSKLLSRLFGAMFVVLFGTWLVRPFLPIYIARLAREGGIADTTAAVGVILTVVGAAQAGSAPFWGRVVDRFGYIRVLSGTTIAAGISLASAGFALRLGVLTLALVLWAAFTAAITTATTALMARTVSAARRGAVLGQIYFPFYVAGLVGPPVGAVLFGAGQPALFGVAALAALAPMLALLSLRRAAA